MRDPKRINRILKLLKKLWSSPDYSDCRLGQLIHLLNRSYGVIDLFYWEDSGLEEALLKELKKKKLIITKEVKLVTAKLLGRIICPEYEKSNYINGFKYYHCGNCSGMRRKDNLLFEK